jgi:hypothetical protein
MITFMALIGLAFGIGVVCMMLPVFCAEILFLCLSMPLGMLSPGIFQPQMVLSPSDVSGLVLQSPDYDAGYNLGYSVGYSDGAANRIINPTPPYGKSSDFQRGYRKGYSDGYSKGLIVRPVEPIKLFPKCIPRL